MDKSFLSATFRNQICCLLDEMKNKGAIIHFELPWLFDYDGYIPSGINVISGKVSTVELRLRLCSLYSDIGINLSYIDISGKPEFILY